MKKIDVFNHVFPKPFYDLMLKLAPGHKDMGKRVRNVPMLVDLDERFRVMDRFEDYHQILSLSSPPIEVMVGPEAAKDLARAGNDGMAELVQKYPDRFLGFIASLPMSDADAAIEEMHRAVRDLGARGLQIYTNAVGQPLDAPQFAPIFDAMADYDLPICLHPARGANFPDYLTEKKSKYEIWWTFGWPYETSVAMARLVFSGLFDRHSNIKIVTHHMGAMIPYFEGRVGPGWDQLGSRTSDEDLTAVRDRLQKRPIDYFRMFYADTAVFGSKAATECGLSFFGADHVLFASDAPFDPEKGPMYIRETVKILDNLNVSDEERAKIYHGNATKLLKLNAS
jgi:predicted TIM-barrel fold metal-dependent hydrolase